MKRVNRDWTTRAFLTAFLLMASWPAHAPTAIAMAIFLLLCGLPVFSKPVITDPEKCVDRSSSQKCCPPRTDSVIVDFISQPSPLRIRRPAHALTQEAAKKYERAVAMMRALPEDHPWNFIQQSKVHCSYCSGGHLQLDLNMTIEIHNSWHFFTWHRAYLYFYERILGKLVNDTLLALPFWNWDTPAGMSIPLIYRDNTSSLFNPTRNPNGINFIDLGSCEPNNSPGSIAKQQQCNLRTMRRQFIAAANSTSLFFGSPLRAGTPSFPGGGTLESSPHGSVHTNTGGDMSRISRSGLDPLFYAHHSNVDRLWTIWDSTPGNGSKSINDPDFLDASFLFWDENMRRVRIKVRDITDTTKLGYVYENVELQWMNIDMKVEGEIGVQAKRAAVSEVIFPVNLGAEVRVGVSRTPGASGETLVVNGIKLDGRDDVWFNIYVSRTSGDGGRMEAGCFVHMGRIADTIIPFETKLQLGITQFINEIRASRDERIVVTFAPVKGGDKVTVGGVSIV